MTLGLGVAIIGVTLGLVVLVGIAAKLESIDEALHRLNTILYNRGK